jgi:hypothetical protein
MASANGLINNNLAVNTLDGLTTVSTSGGTVDPTLYVKYAANTNDTDLSGYNITTSRPPTGSFDLTNKNYVDTTANAVANFAAANYVPYGTGTATNAFQDVDLTRSGNYSLKGYTLTATNKVVAPTAQFTAITSATPSLALGVDGSGNLNTFTVPTATNLIPLNNTWTGTNTFNNTVTVATNQTTSFSNTMIVNTTLTSATAATFTTSGNPSTVPACSLAGSYTLTAGASSGAMGMNLGSFTYAINGMYYPTFVGLRGSVINIVYYVYQYNTAGTAYVPIGGGIALTTSGQTISTEFQANSYSSYQGKIVFYFQGTGVAQSITFTSFSMTVGRTQLNGLLQLSYNPSTPTYTLGIDANSQVIMYANPVSSVFTGSVSSTYIPYASSANVFANSIMYQSGTQLIAGGSIYASGDIGTGSNINATGDVNCVVINPSGGYGRLDDRSLRPKDINAGTEQFFFASWNNDAASPYADAIGMNGWTDSSGGNTNVLMVRKDTYGIRQYQGTFGSTTAFVNSPAGSAQYMDCCMKGVGDNTMTQFTPTGGTWNQTLWVGSGTDKGTAQVITTDGNLHLDPKTGNAIYLGYHRNPTSIIGYASSGMTNYTRYWTHSADVNGDASMYLANQNGGSSAYYNLIIHGSGGNTNHFLNSASRTGDGGQNCYTIRNDTYGGVRFMGTHGGFSSYDGIGTGGAAYTNTIFTYTSGAGTGNIGTWTNYGFTLFCNTSRPIGSQAALGIVSNNYNTNFVVSLSPGVRWMDIQVWAAVHYHYVNGAMAAYLVGGGWVNVSDEREKEDINDLKTSRSLERIMACKPKYYKRKYYDTDKDGKDTTPAPQAEKDAICIGLLAQDVLQTNPHCVSGWKNENIKETDDDDGSRYGINYGDFTVHLIGAVQEQQKQIDAQAKQIAELTALVQSLLKK